MKKIIIIATVLFIALSCKNKSDSEPVKIVYPEYKQTKIDSQIVLLINFHRIENNLEAVKLNQEVSNVCYSHSKWMAENKVVNHYYFQQRADAFPDWYVGENIAYNFKTAESNFTAWKNSEGHNENMLDKRFTEVGISTVYDEDGKSYITCIFKGILKQK